MQPTTTTQQKKPQTTSTQATQPLAAALPRAKQIPKEELIPIFAIKDIFQYYVRRYCSWETLKSIRLVSKALYLASLKSWNSNASLLATIQCTIYDFKKNPVPENLKIAKKYNISPSIRIIHLVDLNRLNELLSDTSLKENPLAPFKKIELDIEIEFQGRVSVIKVSDLPNLTALTIRNETKVNLSNLTALQTLSLFPTPPKLQLTNIPNTTTVNAILHVYNLPPRPKSLLQFPNLNLSLRIRSHDFHTLYSILLQQKRTDDQIALLEKIRLIHFEHILKSSQDLNHIFYYLHQNSTILKSLEKIYMYDFTKRIKVPLPNLNSLKYFEIRNILYAQNISLEHLNLPENFTLKNIGESATLSISNEPNLKSITVKNIWKNSTLKLHNLPQLIHLSIDKIYPSSKLVITEDIFIEFQHVFSNLNLQEGQLTIHPI